MSSPELEKNATRRLAVRGRSATLSVVRWLVAYRVAFDRRRRLLIKPASVRSYSRNVPKDWPESRNGVT